MSRKMKNRKDNKLRNPVAANPLMGKSTMHGTTRLLKRKQRVQSRQSLRKQTDGYNNGDKSEGHWQSGNPGIAFLPVAFIFSAAEL